MCGSGIEYESVSIRFWNYSVVSFFVFVLRSISSAHIKSKDRQHKSQHKSDKRINNDLQNTTQKTKDQVRRNGKQLMLH